VRRYSRNAPDRAPSRKMPSSDTSLRAFHSAGLWLAVMPSPPAAPSSSTASRSVGVGTTPRSTTSHPTDWSPAVTARVNIGPEVRESRPTKIGPTRPSLRHVRPESGGHAGHELRGQGRLRRAHARRTRSPSDHREVRSALNRLGIRRNEVRGGPTPCSKFAHGGPERQRNPASRWRSSPRGSKFQSFQALRRFRAKGPATWAISRTTASVSVLWPSTPEPTPSRSPGPS
jgi:hypothetical protein